MTTSSLVYSTPSPPGTVHTPGTPKHGFGDSWVPFSPRKSARISSRQQSTNRTPSPRPSQPEQPIRSSTKPSIRFSTPTPTSTPLKKRLPAMDSVRRASSTLTAGAAVGAADAMGIAGPSKQQKSQNTIAAAHGLGMLPTPTKTPIKQPNAKLAAASRDIARDIFAADAALTSSPKKKSKKQTGLGLGRFTENADEHIEIYTDSRDRVPEIDNSVDNPFYGDHPPPAPGPATRRSKRKTVAIPGVGRQTIEEAVRRDDGVLVVFRGKKIFRKFSDYSDADLSNLDGEDGQSVQSPRRGPVTRSSIKPRLLFPPSNKGKAVATTSIEDEEAVTDIDDHVIQNDVIEAPRTPVQVCEPKLQTPEAPRFAPASPPSTGRVTRSAASASKLLQEPKVPEEGRAPSPFDNWPRSRSLPRPKRAGAPLAKSPTGTKRQRT